MPRRPLAESVSLTVLDRIINCEYAVGSVLPSESQMGENLGVSRLTVREAFKDLHAKNVLRVIRGRGNFVNDASLWTDIDTVARLLICRNGEHQASLQLLEVRRMIEIGATGIAAVTRDESEITVLQLHLQQMRTAAELRDVEMFVDADIAFHDTILVATKNLLVGVILRPLSELLVSARRETSAVPEIRRNAIAQHERILSALIDSNPTFAREAMSDHMDQTLLDLEHYVLGKQPSRHATALEQR